MRVKNLNSLVFPVAILLVTFLALSFSVLAVQPLDATLCTKADAEIESIILACMTECQNEWNAKDKANYYLYKQAADVECDPQWMACAQKCPGGIEVANGIDYGPKIECEIDCTTAMHACEDQAGEAVKMYAIIESRLTRCHCENCLLPACRFFEDPGCAKTIKTCDGINLLITGSTYPQSSKSYIGCNTSAGAAATLTQIAIASTKGTQKENKTTVPDKPPPQPETPPTTKTTTPKPTVTEPQKTQKTAQVENKIQTIVQNTNAEKKDLVIKKPDNGDKYKIDAEFKTKYYLNKVSEDYIDKIIENVPIVKYFGTLIKAKKDDYVYQGNEEKTKKNMVDYKTDYYGGKAMNHYDDSTEKDISPVKTFFESVAEKTVAPFKWTFDKLGGLFKSETAKSGSVLYKDFEAEVKSNLKAGMDKQTAIEIAKKDFKETVITTRKYGIYTRATKDKDINHMIDTLAKELIDDGKI